jgi:hypothetical protein
VRAERAQLSRHADIAEAIDYMLERWPAFTRFLDDSRICLSNNAAERALRGIARSAIAAGGRTMGPYGSACARSQRCGAALAHLRATQITHP